MKKQSELENLYEIFKNLDVEPIKHIDPYSNPEFLDFVRKNCIFDNETLNKRMTI